VAGRWSYLDQSIAPFADADVGDFVPIPRYDDYQAMLSLALRRDEDLVLVWLASDDHLKRAIPSSDPAEVRSENTDTSWKRLFVRYTRLLADGSSCFVTPSLGYDDGASVTSFGHTPTRTDETNWQYGVRAGYRRRLGQRATLNLGADAEGRYTTARRLGSVNL